MIKKLLFFTLVMFSLIWAENQDYDSDDAEVEYDDLEGSIIFKDYYYMQPASEGVPSPMGTVSIVSSNECRYIDFNSGDTYVTGYYSETPFPVEGKVQVYSDWLSCHFWKGHPYITFSTNIPYFWNSKAWECVVEDTGCKEEFTSGCLANEPYRFQFDDRPFMYRANTLALPLNTGGMTYVLNENLGFEGYEYYYFFDDEKDENDKESYKIALPSNVSEADMLNALDDALKSRIRGMSSEFYDVYFDKRYVKTSREAMDLCRKMGEFYRENGPDEKFDIVDDYYSKVNRSLVSEFFIPPAKSSSSNSVGLSSSSGTRCKNHPMNEPPADSRNACISKNNKCYKCNASRSASECASEWLWTSPRDEFERYWYSEVDCETGAPIENKGLGKCYAHPVNSAPADPKSACVSKSGKCYKCNASRSASECASEWLWTSPRDNFESYWYSEVDCETGALVENKGLGKCYAHPMNSAPADPKSACVSKSGKCYKCNASRSASECASEWLWTSPRDNFESYWYTEVDCQSATPVLAKRGAKGDVPVITNGNMQNEDYSVDFVPRRYFDALGRSTKFTPFKHRPLYADKPVVKKNELPFFTNEDKFTYGSDYVNFAGVLKKEGGNGVVCRNGDICTEGSECVAGSVGNMANTISVNLKKGAKSVRVSDKWTCYDGEARRLGESFVCGVEYYDYGVIEKDGTVVGGMTCTNINYSLYKPDERGVADKNNVDYMLSSKSGYFPHSEKGKAECAVYDGDGKEIHRNLTTSLELAVKTNVRIGYNEPYWVKEGFEIYTEKGEHERFVTREESEMLERHEKNGHVPLYDCLLKYGVLDTIQVVLKDVCDKDYEYDIESQYIVLHNEKDIERLKDAVKNSKVTGRLKKRIDAYMNATVEWFHNDAYKEGCDELSSIFKEECKEPRYDHFDGPYSPIECPSVKEIEKYVPRDLIP